jgi:tyrosine-protein kinase Etk/Wzc
MTTKSPSQPYYNPFEDDRIDFKRYFSLFLSNWYWFAGALFITLSLAYGINRYSGEIYSVSSTLLIQDYQHDGVQTGLTSIIPGGDIFKSNQNLLNEIGILKSFKLNYSVIKDLPEFQIVYVSVGRRGIAETRLYKSCPFEVLTDSVERQPRIPVHVFIDSKVEYRLEIEGIPGFTTHKFGEEYNKNGFKFTLRLRDSVNYVPGKNDLSKKYYFYFVSPEGVANSYRSNLRISPIQEGATIVTLTVTGPVAAQEADYLNKLMENYLGYGLDNKKATADSTITFINKQLGIIADSLKLAEGKLEDFKLSHKILDISREGTMIQNRMEKYETVKATLDLQKQYYDYLTNYVNIRNESGDIISPAVNGISDPTLNSLVENLARTLQNKKRLSFNMAENIPAIDFINKEIELARASLRENLKSSMSELNISYENVMNQIAEENRNLLKLPGTEREMISIQRKFDLNNSVYTYLLEKRAEAGIAQASTVSENRIIDRSSTLNSPQIYPNRKKNYFLAFLIGIFIPVIGIFSIDYLNNKIIDKRDVEKRTKAPILGFISHSEYKNEIPVLSKPGSTLAESFRSVRTALKYYVKESETLVISISSTISSEGKTFISVNLATIIAMLGKKVLLVGLDLRKPRIHKVFNIVNEEGLSSFLSGNCEYKDIINETPVENLFYASSGQIPPNPSELIETENMKKFFEHAKKEYDYIVIDTPPIAVVTDALLLAQYIDLNLFVIRQRYSSKNTLDLINDLYTDGKFKNLGLLINDISLSGYYGYGLRYGYSMGYGYTYGSNYYGKYSYSRYGYSDRDHGYYTEE